jgi:hypothetical protein
VRQAVLAQESKGQQMGLRVEALNGSKQMVQDIFVRVGGRRIVGDKKVFEKNESIFL